MGALLVFTQGTVVAPFIYSLFEPALMRKLLVINRGVSGLACLSW